MTARCQITCTIPWLTCKQLAYPTAHPQISRIRQRDKSEMSLLYLSYKYFVLRHSFSTLSFCILKPIWMVAALFEKPKNSSENLPQQFFKSLIFFLSEKKWASTSSSLRSILSHLLFLLLYFYLLQIYLLSIFLSSPFSYSSNLQTFRNWPRKSSFLPSNLTFSASVCWEIQTLLIWSMQKQIGSLLELRTFP